MSISQNEEGKTTPLFTVFTATYNRANTLHRVYESLQAQTLRDFEWLIVDDGSSDNTRTIVEQWQQSSNFPIRYFWQTNQGKHIAFNYGVQEARGELFLIIDSDDACIPSTLERFAFHWEAISEVERAQFWAVVVLCMDVNGETIGNSFPQDSMNGSYSEIIYKHKVHGDKSAAQRTEVLRQFPFPVIERVKFISEAVIWFEICHHYQIRFINEKLYIVHQQEAEHSDRLSQAPISKVAAGCAMQNQVLLTKEMRWFRYAPLEFLRSAALYSRFSFYIGKGVSAQASELPKPISRALWMLCLPIGYFFYLRDIKKINKDR